MRIIHTELPEIVLIEPQVFQDSRGYFFETHHLRRYAEYGIGEEFVQDNSSFSTHGVLRGLHYQRGQPQAKLVMVLSGEIYDVAVDIRRNSPTFGRWVGTTLSSENKRQLFIPRGFAHGFCVTGETATVYYKCTDYYASGEERGILWNDPALNIMWPVEAPILSEKDANNPSLDQLDRDQLPEFRSQ